MTREELKEHCKKTVEQCEMWAIHRGEEPSGKVYEEHKAVLDILEQQPCDAISREAVLDLLQMKYFGKELYMAIYELPSVTQKSGKWIRSIIYENTYNCSKCGSAGYDTFKYCPNCGAKMVEPQESEDKE